jgi:hypothetical protein
MNEWFKTLFITFKGTKHISELTSWERAEFDNTGCGEGYEWWLRHQGLLTSKYADEGLRNYPPKGKWYSHIKQYHKWLWEPPK